MGNGNKFKMFAKSVNIGICLIIMVIIVQGSVAYFTDIDEVVNEVMIGHVEVTPVEEFNPPDEIIPGEAFVKDVKFSNTGPVDCYVRAKVMFTDGDMKNYSEVDFNTTDYVYNSSDGYYYLKEKLEILETTPSLFTTVTLKEKYDKNGDGTEDTLTEEDMKEFEVLVYVEGYQTIYNDPDNGVSREFTDYQEAWNHFARHK